MKHPHYSHVREHLERVRDGYSFIPDPESIYLGKVETDHFWELVGLRLQGCPVVVLAALRFDRQDRPGVPDARESLATYLSANPDLKARESTKLTALLPNKDQEISAFLNGLRAGRQFAPVSIDRLRVEVAFDFRADNPSAVRGLRDAASPLGLGACSCAKAATSCCCPATSCCVVCSICCCCCCTTCCCAASAALSRVTSVVRSVLVTVCCCNATCIALSCACNCSMVVAMAAALLFAYWAQNTLYGSRP